MSDRTLVLEVASCLDCPLMRREMMGEVHAVDMLCTALSQNGRRIGPLKAHRPGWCPLPVALVAGKVLL